MKIGDNVKMSEKNPNHLGSSIDPYAGYEGKVVQLWEDGSFCISKGGSELVVPMNMSNKKPKKGIWIYLNGKHIFHLRIDKKPANIKRLYQWFVPEIDMEKINQ